MRESRQLDAIAAGFTGPVVRVLDGDTFEVLHNHHPEHIRLNGIDCPENGQAFGLFAEHAAADLVLGKQVTLLTHGLDEHGRMIGDMILPDGMNLNQELVRQGLCWWYPKYAPGDTVLERLENKAQEARKCVWDDPQSVPPWEWGETTQVVFPATIKVSTANIDRASTAESQLLIATNPAPSHILQPKSEPLDWRKLALLNQGPPRSQSSPHYATPTNRRTGRIETRSHVAHCEWGLNRPPRVPVTIQRSAFFVPNALKFYWAERIDSA